MVKKKVEDSAEEEFGDMEEAEEISEGSESEEPHREMFTIKCSECGKDAEVPFKPTEGRPVYCRDCFMKHRPPRRSFGGGYNRRH